MEVAGHTHRWKVCMEADLMLVFIPLGIFPKRNTKTPLKQGQTFTTNQKCGVSGSLLLPPLSSQNLCGTCHWLAAVRAVVLCPAPSLRVSGRKELLRDNTGKGEDTSQHRLLLKYSRGDLFCLKTVFQVSGSRKESPGPGMLRAQMVPSPLLTVSHIPTPSTLPG